MNDITYNFTLDIAKEGCQTVLSGIKTVDDLSRTLYISLTNGGEPYILTDDVSAQITAKIGDAMFTDLCSVDVENNRIEYTVKNILIENPGIQRAELQLSDGVHTFATCDFAFYISEAATDDAVIMETDQFLSMIAALANTEQATQNANNLVTEVQEKLDRGDFKGDKGDTGDKGDKGDTGNGIASISLVSTVGSSKTYRITYTNGNHFDFIVNDGVTQTVEQHYDPTSENAQAGTAVAEAVADKQPITDELLETEDKSVVGAINENNSGILNLQYNIEDIEGLIPAQASGSNQLADKEFVNSSIATNTANFIGTFYSVDELKEYTGTVTNNDYAFVVNQVVKYSESQIAFPDKDTLDFETDVYLFLHVTNGDYAYVVNGNRFDLYRLKLSAGAYIGIAVTWEYRTTVDSIVLDDLNTVYNRYKSREGTDWYFEYQLNNSSFTAVQWAAINSGITADAVEHIARDDVFASSTKAGVSKVDGIYGISAVQSGEDAGKLRINYAQEAEINNRNGSADILKRKPIVPNNLDYAVKTSLSGNKYTLTAAEKAAIKNWLGVSDGSDKFIVNATHLNADNTVAEVDKSYSEIITAYDSGKIVELHASIRVSVQDDFYDNVIYRLSGVHYPALPMFTVYYQGDIYTCKILVDESPISTKKHLN